MTSKLNNSNLKNKEPLSAVDVFSKEIENIKIITMCESLDKMLGGGFPCGKLTEICGSAGIGKTQICFQACITVQIPRCIGGLEGEAVYIDTEGSFNTNRILQMAKYTLEHCRKIAKELNLSKDELNKVNSLTEADILNSIFVFRCTEQKQLLSLSYRLFEFCDTHPRVRLIMIDSIAFHFRYDSMDFPKRNRILTVIGNNLLNIANQFCVVIILTNQMTTKFSDGNGYPIPALGDSWGHICHIRIQLLSTKISTISSNDIREAVLTKHVSQPYSSTFYQITIGGIRNTIFQ